MHRLSEHERQANMPELRTCHSVQRAILNCHKLLLQQSFRVYSSPMLLRLLHQASNDQLSSKVLLWLTNDNLLTAAGGAFIVQLPDSLTTFTVSMVYLLMRSFSGLSMVKPFTSCSALGARFLVCMGRLDDANIGALWLQEVSDSAFADVTLPVCSLQH